MIITLIIFGSCFSLLSAQTEGVQVAGFDCDDCHGSQGWESLTYAGFTHQQTAFPLEGVHQSQPCTACHSGATIEEKHRFSTRSGNCLQCHLDVHQSTLGSDCNHCHSMQSWQVDQRTFDHELTSFSLLGAHQSISYQDCHTEQPMTVFNATASDCFGCHAADYQNAVEPSHSLARLDRDCRICHSETVPRWRPSTFDHSVDTEYSLTGAHRESECAGCHVGNFEGTPTDCWNCHQTEFELTGTSRFPDAPDHNITPLYSEDCSICHSTETWIGGEIDHNQTDFPLTGKHLDTECNSCHGESEYELPLSCDGCHIPSGIAETSYELAEYDHVNHNIVTECEACHTTINWDDDIFQHETFETQECLTCHLIDHTISTEPPHGNENIGTDCSLCHATDQWTIDSFLHSLLQTGYPLTGLHITVECITCHQNQIYNTTPTLCSASPCHLTDFNETTLPNHSEFGYPPDNCDACHNTLGWQPHIYTHQLDLDCISCHWPDYQSATDPVHDETQGFSTACDLCHSSTTTWKGATFDHSNVNQDCEIFHMDDYDLTNHAADQYPPVCNICHISTESWTEASFFHDTQYFPIFSGEHQGEWSSCQAECHVDVNDYSVFSCGLNGVCHEHDQSTMDEEHNDEPNYLYESNACYDCHPTGGEDDGDEDDIIRRDDRRNQFRDSRE